MEELVTLYAALANRGRLRPLRYREDDVNPEGVRILSEEASFMIHVSPPLRACRS